MGYATPNNAFTNIVANLAEAESNWLTLAYPADASPTDIAAFRNLNVGDTIRVGTAATNFTNYLTVLEVVDFTELRNPTTADWSIGNPSNIQIVAQSGSTVSSFVSTTGANRSVRVNHMIDAATIPNIATFKRHSIRLFSTNVKAGSEALYFPCYKQRKLPHILRMQLPTNIGAVSAIELKGYSIVHSRRVGYQHQHEMKDNDWLAIRVKEIHGPSVLSNNMHANGALHIIPEAARHSDSITFNATAYEPAGIARVDFTPKNMPSLTVELLNHNGEAAPVGRMNMWLKILVLDAR